MELYIGTNYAGVGVLLSAVGVLEDSGGVTPTDGPRPLSRENANPEPGGVTFASLDPAPSDLKTIAISPACKKRLQAQLSVSQRVKQVVVRLLNIMQIIATACNVLCYSVLQAWISAARWIGKKSGCLGACLRLLGCTGLTAADRFRENVSPNGCALLWTLEALPHA